MGPASDDEEASKDLVDKAQHGDTSAIGMLLAHHMPGLVGWLRKNAGHLIQARESCEDLAQSVCREILEGLRTERFEYRGEAEFKQWLYKAAFHKITNRRRFYEAEKRDAGREILAGNSTTSASMSRGEALFRSLCTPSQDAAFQEELKRFEAAFAQLPANYGEIISLAYFERLSHADIGKRLGISEGNSRVLLSRALARLARLGVERPE